jgi:apolipoprotein N-acyltransferase
VSRYLVAIAAGVTLSASFQKMNVAGFAWIAPALMLFAALGKRGAEAYRIGYVAGLTHYLVSLYWLLNIPYRWHSIPVAPAAGWLALAAFMALFPAFWVWATLRLAETRKPQRKAAHQADILEAQPPFQAGFLESPWSRRAAWMLSGACLWVGTEMVIARIFGGFPWNLLGVSQAELVPLIQVASITGVYGVSFLVVWLSLALFSAALLLIRRPGSRQALILEVVVPMLGVAVLFAYGLSEIRQAPPETRSVRVAVIQPSIPQTLIWDETRDSERFEELLHLTETAVTNSPNVVLWPEAAVPKLLRYDREMYEKITGLARQHKVWMILGADDAEPKEDNPKQARYFNSSFLINPEGKVVAYYQKRGLVIFGEYLPMSKWLGFLKWFTPIQDGFTAGRTPGHFTMSNLGLSASVLICFEDVFPHLARQSVSDGTDLLVNLTNDGWFGESAAQWQQAATALFRAVENRVPLVRCTNNGITCWIDGYGRIRQTLRDSEGSVYGKGYAVWDISLPERRAEPTFYTRNGDVFGWFCAAVGVLLLLTRSWPLRRVGARGPDPDDKATPAAA